MLISKTPSNSEPPGTSATTQSAGLSDLAQNAADILGNLVILAFAIVILLRRDRWTSTNDGDGWERGMAS